MELTFDSIYKILNQIEHNPEMVTKTKSPYENVVQLFIPDSIHIDHEDFYFPANKLMVNLLPEDFINKHQHLFKTYWEMAGKPIPYFDEVWITTAHLNQSKVYLIELSFE